MEYVEHDIVNRGILVIPDSQIPKNMLRHVTRRMIDQTWKGIVQTVPYASKVINMLEHRVIYDGACCLVDEDDPVLKPDHTASRGFVDTSECANALEGFDPKTASYSEVMQRFTPLTGTALQVVVLQMLGARLGADRYQFKMMHAQGAHLYFQETGDLTLDHTKHFVSNQDISQLDPEYQEGIKSLMSGYELAITEDDWNFIQSLYKGKTLDHNELEALTSGLSDRIFSCVWQIDSDVAARFKAGAANGEKPLEYAYSTLLRGSRLNHSTWRVADIIKGLGALYAHGYVSDTN